ncbi:competence/damage-inducible protein A [Bacteroidota bacterium]
MTGKINYEAGIIVIGNEVLSGVTLDTNSQYIGLELNKIGISIRRKLTIPDLREDILHAVSTLWDCCDIILVSGGLGPTNDDITKKVLAEYFDSELVFNQLVFEQIEKMLSKHFRTISEAHRSQAWLPAKAKVMINTMGTASGMLFNEKGKILIALPGVPFELHGLIDREVVPYLRELTSTQVLINMNIRTVGIAESMIADRIKDIEDGLPAEIKLAYLPGIGQVKLRLTASNAEKKELETKMNDLTSEISVRLNEFIYAYDETSFEEAIGHLLLQNKVSLAVAESCTGGYLSHLITSIPGSSAYYKGGIIAYSNEIKSQILKVESGILEQYGAVSQECAEAMASGVRKLLNSDYAVSTTGIAGPDGGTDEKAVGTVCLAVASEKEVVSKMIVFDRGRIQNIQYSSITVLNLLRKLILAEGNNC